MIKIYSCAPAGLTDLEIKLLNNAHDVDLDYDKEIYGHLMKFRPDWRQKILALEGNKNYDRLNWPLETKIVSSYYMYPVLFGSPGDDLRLALNLLLITKDERIMAGIRGGNVVAGEIALMPVGCTPYFEGKQPLQQAVYDQLRRETGLASHEVYSEQLIGHQIYTPKSVDLVFLAHTDKSSADLINMHKETYMLYSDKKMQGKTEEEARDAIACHENPDAWEHSELLGLDGMQVETIIRTSRLHHKGTGFKVCDVTIGAARLYHEFLKPHFSQS